MRTKLFWTTVLLVAWTVAPVAAQSCDTIYWIKQGEQERYYSYGEEIVLKAGDGAIFRVHYKSRSPSPYTTSSQIGHPSDFGLKGYKRADQRGVIRMKAQQQQHIDIGKINLEVGSPGQASIGYRIVSAGRGQVRIPENCLTGVAWIRVVARGGGGAGAGPPGGRGNWNVGGVYTTRWGAVRLSQRGDTVEGSYEHNYGRIEGTVQGNVLSGSWSQAPSYRAPQDAGTFQFTFYRNGAGYNGVWRYGYSGQWEAQWNGTRSR